MKNLMNNNNNNNNNNNQDLARELKKLWNMKVTVIIIVIDVFSSHQRIGARTGRHRNKRTSGDHPNNSIIEIDQNTEKSPGESLSLKLH